VNPSQQIFSIRDIYDSVIYGWALKIKIVRNAVREMARHDMNDCGWPVTSLADQMNISPTHAE
jgi:hypothetical protein